MKKSFFKTFVALLFLGILLAGCEPIETTPQVSPKMTTSISDTTIVKGSTLIFEVSASKTLADLQSVEITVNGDLVPEEDVIINTEALVSNPLLLEEEDRTNFRLFFKLKPLGVLNIPQQYTITLTDEDNFQVSHAFVVIEEEVDTIIDTELSGEIFDALGLYQGAFDLKEGTTRWLSEDAWTMDMVNLSFNDTPFNGSWGATSINATQYVYVPNFDYEYATYDAAKSTFNNSTSSLQVWEPSEGDIYIAKLRNTGEYAVIKITGIDPDFCQQGDICEKKGRMTFTYKK